MTKDQLVKHCLDEIGVALKRFGTYSYDDKGPHEVMDVDSLEEKMRSLSAQDAGDVILELAKSKKHDGRGEYLASTLLCNMQDWDELFEIPGVSDYL